MKKKSSSFLAPPNELDIQPIDRTKTVIISRTRESKYNPNKCSNNKANQRRITQMMRQQHNAEKRNG